MTRPSFFTAIVLGILSIIGASPIVVNDKLIVSTEDTFPSNRPSLRTPTMSPVTIPTLSPSSQPTMRDPSIKKVKFQQEFEMRGNRRLSAIELAMIRALYQSYTDDFSPLPPVDIDNKIATTCTIVRQVIVEDKSSKNQETTSSTLYLEYTMAYESINYNVEEYPKLFQNWTANNLDVMLQQMEFLTFGVNSVGIPKRILIATFSPSRSPSTMPTATHPPTTKRDILYITTNRLGLQPHITETIAPHITETIAPTVMEISSCEQFNLIMHTMTLAIAFASVAVGLFGYYSRKRRANQQEDRLKNSSRTIGTATTGMSGPNCKLHKKHKTDSESMVDSRV